MLALKDRFTRGFIAGAGAGILTSVLNSLLYYLNFAKLRFLDFAAVMIFGHRPNNMGESLFAFIGQIGFYGLLGIVFLFIIPRISSSNLLLKSSIFGVTVWFSVYAVVVLYKIPELEVVSLSTALSNFIVASIWGVLLGYMVGRLDRLLTVPAKKIKKER